MTNREKIQRAFDAVQPSGILNMEEMNMKQKPIKKPLVLVCACIALLAVFLTAAYAADLGGFRQTLTVWCGGKQQTVEVTQPQEGMLQWTGEDGMIHTSGGIAVEDDGTERPLTLEELLDEQFSERPVLNFYEDGRAFLEFFEHYVDVTDQLDSGRIEAALEHDGVLYYITYIGSREIGWTLHQSTEGFQP